MSKNVRVILKKMKYRKLLLKMADGLVLPVIAHTKKFMMFVITVGRKYQKIIKRYLIPLARIHSAVSHN